MAGEVRAAPAPLSPAEAVDYWDTRHRRAGPLTSGGDLGTDHASNELFYAMRLGRLVDILGDCSDPAAPLRILDAGCGKGYFTRALAGFGHRVDGIDASEHAIETCRAVAGPRETYHRSELHLYQPAVLYDAVLSIDVLFHIMDDEQWEASVRNLATLVRWGGLLVLADHDDDEDRVWSSYQRTRSAQRYRALVEPLGLRPDAFVPYRFRHTPVGFHVWTRMR